MAGWKPPLKQTPFRPPQLPELAPPDVEVLNVFVDPPEPAVDPWLDSVLLDPETLDGLLDVEDGALELEVALFD